MIVDDSSLGPVFDYPHVIRQTGQQLEECKPFIFLPYPFDRRAFATTIVSVIVRKKFIAPPIAIGSLRNPPFCKRGIKLWKAAVLVRYSVGEQDRQHELFV